MPRKERLYSVGYGAGFGTDTENTQLRHAAKQGRGDSSDVTFFPPCNFYEIFQNQIYQLFKTRFLTFFPCLAPSGNEEF